MERRLRKARRKALGGDAVQGPRDDGGVGAGYNAGADAAAVPRHVRAQAEAIFGALKRAGITYVSSLFVMGEHVGQAQRIRLPRETLALASAT